MCSTSLAAAVTILAGALAEGRSAEELSLLAAVLTQLGDTLATMSLQKGLCDASKARS